MKVLAVILVAQFGVPFPSTPSPVVESPASPPLQRVERSAEVIEESSPEPRGEIEETSPVAEEGVSPAPTRSPSLAEQVPEGLGEQIGTGSAAWGGYKHCVS
ncbi:hypothetical protein [Lyngbya confervoides]|uniref:Secreted mucin n=1 Tax=Lyngbya confervoides BDU141951 TaxID=1574623 RepID=A0ABD4T1J4_9CYAN|nr:hypothetical protein [Lyngbya confervoides]MCM1982152.1 hypothetical protein [Lyngbya confervoides BDU141951]